MYCTVLYCTVLYCTCCKDVNWSGYECVLPLEVYCLGAGEGCGRATWHVSGRCASVGTSGGPSSGGLALLLPHL